MPRPPKGLSKQAQERYVRYAQSGAEVKMHNPNADMSVVEAYLREYAQADINEFQPEINRKAKLENDIGEPLDKKYIRRKYNEDIVKFDKKFDARVQAGEFGEGGKATWRDLGERVRPTTLPGAVIKQFHNKDKGGFLISGIIGGIVGGVYIFGKLGGLGGGPISIIGTALAAVSGAWLANMSSEAIGGFIDKNFGKDKEKDVNAPQTSQTPELEQQKSQEKTNDQARSFEELKPNIGQIVSNEKIGGTRYQVAEASEKDNQAPNAASQIATKEEIKGAGQNTRT